MLVGRQTGTCVSTCKTQQHAVGNVSRILLVVKTCFQSRLLITVVIINNRIFWDFNTQETGRLDLTIQSKTQCLWLLCSEYVKTTLQKSCSLILEHRFNR